MALYELRVVPRTTELPKIGKLAGSIAESKPYIQKLKHILPFCREIRNHDQEHVLIITLDEEHKVITARIVHIGSANECCVGLSEVFKGAIIDNASYIIFIHNHPGKLLRPSRSDKRMLKELCKAGRLLQIPILDFVIVSEWGIYSENEGKIIRDRKSKE